MFRRMIFLTDCLAANSMGMQVNYIPQALWITILQVSTEVAHLYCIFMLANSFEYIYPWQERSFDTSNITGIHGIT